jgi:hypothetical protein
MDNFNEKKVKGLYMQSKDLQDISKSFFDHSLIFELHKNILRPLYQDECDFNLYSEQLLIFKSLLDLYSKILEFFGCEMFNYQQFQNEIGGLNSFEIFFCQFIRLESEILLKF